MDEMFSGAQVLFKGEAKNGASGTHWIGLEWDTDKVKTKNYISLSADPKAENDLAWSMCKGHTVAWNAKWASVKSMSAD